tara:strand:+ start:1104 stop:1394 length:291 start_codon:yes stop_codon:yes gene_type:complete
MEMEERVSKKIEELRALRDPRIDVRGLTVSDLDQRIEAMRVECNARMLYGLYPDLTFLAIRQYLIVKRIKCIPTSHFLWAHAKIAQAVLAAKKIQI